MKKSKRQYLAAILILLSACSELEQENELLNVSCGTPIVDNQVAIIGTSMTFTAADLACSQKTSYYSMVLTKDKTVLTIQLGGSKLPGEATTFDLEGNSLSTGSARITLTTPTNTYLSSGGNLYFKPDNGRISLEFCSIELSTNNYIIAEIAGRVVCK